MNARKKLAQIEAKIVEANGSARAVDLRRAELKDRLSDLEHQATLAVEHGDVAVDGTPGTEEVRELLADLAATRERLSNFDATRAAKIDGFRRRRAKLEAEREQFTRAHFDEIVAELIESGARTRKLTDDALATVRVAAEAWAMDAGAWLSVERAAGMSANPATRLDLPAFPISVNGDANVAPVPSTLAEGELTLSAA